MKKSSEAQDLEGRKPRKPAVTPLAPYERLLEIRVLGRRLRLPENNTLLRGFSWLDPERVACGKFCWNGECNNSKLFFRLPGETVERKARACRYLVREGMEITLITPELKWALRHLLEYAEAEEEAEAAGPESAAGAR
jgi:hypothetical protein